jgi:Icc-related predicted phosphoesterase
VYIASVAQLDRASDYGSEGLGVRIPPGALMGIIYLGDIHGEMGVFDRLRPALAPDDVIIQVGDFGIDPLTAIEWDEAYGGTYPCPVYFIDGNHENFDVIEMWSKDEVTEIAKGLFYIPRGMVLNIKGQRIGFLGGGPSIDKYWRIVGRSWWPQELITPNDVTKLVCNVGNEPLDVLVTHVAPLNLNVKHFGKLCLEEWELPANWVDNCSMVVETLVDSLKPKLHVCGHMHRSVRDGVTKILDINEAWVPGYGE